MRPRCLVLEGSNAWLLKVGWDSYEVAFPMQPSHRSTTWKVYKPLQQGELPMTKKPNFAKCILGVFVLAILFIGTWATTSARLTSAKKSAVSPTALSISPNLVSRYAAPLAPASGDDNIFSVFEIDGDIFDSASPGDDWEAVNCDGGNADVKTGVIHDGSGVSIFTQGGSKDPNDVSAWRWTDGAVPDKDDLLNAYAAKYTGSPNGDTII